VIHRIFSALVLAGLTGLPANAYAAVKIENVEVARVIDGDTIVITDGTKVRLLGIDAPERGECGYSTATKKLKALVEGKTVNLVGTKTDKYDRRLAYVDIAGIDAGAELIMAGLVRPRYNATDGYGRNSRDDTYFSLAGHITHICGLDMTKYTAANTQSDSTDSYSAKTETKYVTATSLNIRSGPGTNHPKQGKLSYGDKVTVVATTDGWQKLSTGGWVSGIYLANSAPRAGSSSTGNTTSPATTSPPRSAPSVKPTAPAGAQPPYQNCTAVWNAIGRPIKAGELGFHAKLDRDNDGVGCEQDPR